MRFEQTAVVVECPQHGKKLEVMVSHEDAFGFRNVARVCESCLEEAIEQYLEPCVCQDCSTPVPKGLGIERGGVMMPLCKPCMGARLTRSVRSELS